MRSRLLAASAWAIAVVCLAAPVPSFAQVLNFDNLKGKVVAVSGNVIQWTDATSAEMYVQIDTKTKVQVSGKVEPSFLSPGLFVRFSADVTKRGKITGEIGDLTVFSPAEGYSVGLLPEGNVDPNALSAKYLIAGQIESNKNGQLVIQAGEQSFKFKLSDDAKLKIDVADYSIARPDDEITINGSGERKDQIIARGVEIELATPLAGVEKKSRRSPGKKPVRKPAANVGKSGEFPE